MRSKGGDVEQARSRWVEQMGRATVAATQGRTGKGKGGQSKEWWVMGKECLEDMAVAMEKQGQQMWAGGTRVVTPREREAREELSVLGDRHLDEETGQGRAELREEEWEAMLEEEEELQQDLAAMEEEQALQDWAEEEGARGEAEQ